MEESIVLASGGEMFYVEGIDYVDFEPENITFHFYIIELFLIFPIFSFLIAN